MRAALTALLLLLMAAPRLARAEPSELERAYQREFAYLKAEEGALKERLASSRADGELQRARAQGDLDALTARLLSLGRATARLEEQLAEADRAAAKASEGGDLLQGTLTAAATTLDLPDAAQGQGDADRLRQALTAAVAALKAGGEVRAEPGAFFLPSGAEARGSIVRVGRVAAYGVSDGGSGALAPAGEGRLRLLDTASADAAHAVLAGSPPATLPLFLFEGLEKRYEPRAEKQALEVVEAGGPIAWVIVALGAAALLMVLLRAATLLAAALSRRAVDRGVLPLLEAGRPEDAVTRCASAPGPYGRVLARILAHRGADAEHLESVATEALLHEAPRLERFSSALAVLAAVSPLLGLLGTVTGIIATFDIITEFGTGDPKMLSGGISEALITTELGLIVAIPALLIGTLLNSQAESTLDELERLALTVASQDGAASAERHPDRARAHGPDASALRVVTEGA